MNKSAAYAQALAAAFASDISTPAIAAAIQKGGLTRRQFTRIVNRDVARGLTGERGPALFPSVRAFVRQLVDIDAIKRSGQTAATLEADLNAAAATSTLGGIASIGGALAAAVGAIWGAKITADANKSLAKIQLQEAQIVQNSQLIAAKSALIQNATANGLRANADGQPIDPSSGEPLSEVGAAARTKVAGIPVWGIATGVVATVVGGYFALKG